MTYAKVVDAANRIEIGRIEHRTSKETSKKSKVKGSFSRGSSSDIVQE